uniref:Solute carrier family 25 member 33 n=1 Tax=Sinocyclocheilus grahami TaxID=75366 RepID=A0A672MP73_SINGR
MVQSENSLAFNSPSHSTRKPHCKKMNALQCARYVYKTEGMRGFYRGLTASYAGISETMICFLIYETLKKYLVRSRFTTPDTDTEKGASDFLGLMVAAAFAKGCASCIAYPHAVVRIRDFFQKHLKNLTITKIFEW